MACSSGAAADSENVGLVAQPASDAAISSIVMTPAVTFREFAYIRMCRL
jgi:hypothetical protein